MSSIESRLTQLERRREKIDRVISPLFETCPHRHRLDSQAPAAAVEAVWTGDASLRQYELVCAKEVESYRRDCLAFAPLIVLGALRGFCVADDRLALAYPPGVEVPTEAVSRFEFAVWLAGSDRAERRAYAGMSVARAGDVSARARQAAAVQIAVLGGADASRLRSQIWTQRPDGGWELNRSTWAPSDVTARSADFLDSLLGLSGVQSLRCAASKQDIQERTFRLPIGEAVEFVTKKGWTGDAPIPEWTKSVKISHPPRRSGWAPYREHIAYNY